MADLPIKLISAPTTEKKPDESEDVKRRSVGNGIRKNFGQALKKYRSRNTYKPEEVQKDTTDEQMLPLPEEPEFEHQHLRMTEAQAQSFEGFGGFDIASTRRWIHGDNIRDKLGRERLLDWNDAEAECEDEISLSDYDGGDLKGDDLQTGKTLMFMKNNDHTFRMNRSKQTVMSEPVLLKTDAKKREKRPSKEKAKPMVSSRFSFKRGSFSMIQSFRKTVKSMMKPKRKSREDYEEALDIPEMPLPTATASANIDNLKTAIRGSQKDMEEQVASYKNRVAPVPMIIVQEEKPPPPDIEDADI